MYLLKTNRLRSIYLLVLCLCFSCEIEDQIPVAEETAILASAEESGFELDEIPNAGEKFKLGPWNMIHEETFEEDPFYAYVTTQFAASHSFKTVNSPAFKGGKSGRFELRRNDPKATNTGKRSEVLFNQIDSKEAWYSFAVNFPSNGYAKDRDDEIISQWHNGGGTPTLCLRVRNDRLIMRIGHDSKIKTADWANYDIGSIARSKWDEFVFHVIHSDGNDGVVEVWRNGEKLVSHKGANLYKGRALPRWKVGIYKATWENKSTDSDLRVLYFDNVRIGNSRSNFSEMKPSTTNTKGWGPLVPEIKSFSLVNTITNKIIGTVANNGTVNIQPLNDNRISLRANFGDSFNGSVEFDLKGAKNYKSVDNTYQYSVYGESGSGQFYNQGGTPVGEYTLTSTPYISKNKGGKIGTTNTFKFKVVKQSTASVILGATNTIVEEVKDVILNLGSSSSNLMGYWKMDESSTETLTDYSGNGNDARVLNSNGVHKVSGKEGRAIRMNGELNRFASVPHKSSLNMTNGLTIAAWIKPNSKSRKQIISKGGKDGYELSIFENGKIEFRFNRESDGWKYRLYSNASYPTNGNTWMHVAVTFDGSKTTLYINGSPDNSATYSPTTIKSNSSEVQIGARDNINRWTGDLDEIRLYNKALSASEISSIAK